MTHLAAAFVAAMAHLARETAWPPSAAHSPSDQRLRLLSAESPFARNDFENPERLRIVDQPVSIEKNRLQVEMPPHSVGALVLV